MKCLILFSTPKYSTSTKQVKFMLQMWEMALIMLKYIFSIFLIMLEASP